MTQLDDLLRKAPEVYHINNNYRLTRIHEFTYDDVIPPMGAMVMWEPPDSRFNYTVGVDPSWGLGQDRSAIHVLRNGTLYSPDTQVAEFVADDINMHDLTPIVYAIGNLYKNTQEDLEALVTVECNISDDIVHNLRLKYNYGNLFIWKYYDSIKRIMSNKLGWWTTHRTRPKLINKAMQYISHGWWEINSPWLINELETIEKLEEHAQIKAASGFYDDMFMAGTLALWSAHDLEFNSEFGQAEVAAQRDRRISDMLEATIAPLPPLAQRRDYINTAVTYDQMMADGDF